MPIIRTLVAGLGLFALTSLSPARSGEVGEVDVDRPGNGIEIATERGNS